MYEVITSLGELQTLNLNDQRTQNDLLADDKHRLLEGAVFERFFDEIMSESPDFEQRYKRVDVHTALIRLRDGRQLAFVLNPSNQPFEPRLLNLLNREMLVWVVDFEEKTQQFYAQRFINRTLRWLIGLECLNERDLDRVPVLEVVAQYKDKVRGHSKATKEVRNEDRQRVAIGYIRHNLGNAEVKSLVLERIFFNNIMSKYFYNVWNVDRIYIEGARVLFVEVKHKYPMRNGKSFGLNSGEVQSMKLADRLGAENFHVIFVKPIWEKDYSTVRILEDKYALNNMLIIARHMSKDSIEVALKGATKFSKVHTSMDGKKRTSYKDLAVEDFRKIGFATESPNKIAHSILDLFEGVAGWHCKYDDLLQYKLAPVEEGGRMRAEDNRRGSLRKEVPETRETLKHAAITKAPTHPNFGRRTSAGSYGR